MAEHDALTGAWNHTSFVGFLTAAIGRCRADSKLAVFFVDIDRFKNINDTMGHMTGDRVLEAVAERLQDTLGAAATLARLGGDEFAFFIEGLQDLAAVRAAAERVIQAFGSPLDFDGRRQFVSVSLGAAMGPDDALTAEELIRAADMAMYEAKLSGRRTFRFYDHRLESEARERASIQSELNCAVEGLELSAAYQPQVEITTGKILGVECLLRWTRATERGIPISKVISIAEESGLILPIGDWVLEHALAQASAWRREGLEVPMAVNLSAVQIQQETLYDAVTGRCGEHTIPTEGLKVEITESVLLSYTAEVQKSLLALHEAGVAIVLDDFGTGYASLAYLRHFPIEEVKIDSSFLHGIGNSTSDEAIVRSVIQLAHSLEKRVVAEGVEHRHQLEFLRDAGCDMAQGYLFSPAVPAAEMQALLEQRPPEWGAGL